MYNLSIKSEMKKMRFLFSQFFLLALLALPLVATSCSDDDPKEEIGAGTGKDKVEISLGLEEGAKVSIGQIVQLEAQIKNLEGELTYKWQINDQEVSTESKCTFIPEEKGTYTINLTVTSGKENHEATVNVIAQMYPSSFYVVNEGQYGKSPGSINHYKEGVWSNDIIKGLGETTTVGVINGDYMYIVSKTTPFLVKMKLSDHSIAGRIEEDEDVFGYNAQGQNFCIVNDELGILTTANGAFKVDLAQCTLGERLEGFEDARLDKEDICKVGNYIFITKDKTIKVYNANDLTFNKDLAHSAETGFARTKDGILWAANKNKLIKIDVATLSSEEIDLPGELNVYYDEYAYKPTGLAASTTENTLYFANMVTEGYSAYGKDIYKYNTETSTATKFFSIPADDKSVYGAGIQVNPSNGDVYLIYTEDGWGEHFLNTNIYIADGITGNQKAIIDYSGKYWFPSTITFQ